MKQVSENRQQRIKGDDIARRLVDEGGQLVAILTASVKTANCREQSVRNSPVTCSLIPVAYFICLHADFH
jgi:hypothetical protein